jgi:thioredoxin-dependent peroxiredoxin
MNRPFVGLMIVGGLVLAGISICAADDAIPATQPAIQPATQPDTSNTGAEMQTPILTAGTPAPSFDLPSNRGGRIALADFAGKQIVVLYFYPKADTPGCTKEACGFRDALADYDKSNVAVLGISPDPVDAITHFSDKYHLNFPLLADSDHSVAEKYGVWQGRLKRTTFVIGRDGTILHVFENVKPQGHDQEVLNWLKANAS